MPHFDKICLLEHIPLMLNTFYQPINLIFHVVKMMTEIIVSEQNL